mmetsp:Transcript_27390/g.89651  ORF Transcript_27390/g.89651 Transcript_27390/m.89651 type:complete len:316 (-) Transcript_27390:657-1604(-)
MQSKEVRERHCSRSVRRLALSRKDIFAKHLARGEDSPLPSDHPAFNNVHLRRKLALLYDLLALRKGFAPERQCNLRHKVLGRAAEERDVADPRAALLHRHLAAQRRAHEIEQHVPVLHTCVAPSVAEVGAQTQPQIDRQVCLLHKVVEVIEQLVKFRVLLVHVGHDPAHGADHVRKHARPNHHGDDDVGAFLRSRRDYVAVPDRAHRHQRPVQSRDVLVVRRDVEARAEALVAVILPVVKLCSTILTPVVVALKVRRHPIVVRAHHLRKQPPDARQPVRDEERPDDKLVEHQQVVIHVDVVLEAAQDAARTEHAQ